MRDYRKELVVVFTIYTPKEISDMGDAVGKLVAVQSSIFEVSRLMSQLEVNKESEIRLKLPRGHKILRDEYLICNVDGTCWWCKRKYITE